MWITQRRLRRPLHRVREGRRRAVHRRSSSSARSAGSRSGKEEHKMGLHGSSTTTDPAAGRAGAGRQRARRDRQGPQGRAQHAQLRPLQPGRDVRRRQPRSPSATPRAYAAARKQFGQPIAAFGAIKHKLGEMTARTYALESLVVPHRRTDRRDAIAQSGHDGAADRAGVRGVRRRGVDRQGRWAARSLDYVLDENVQIHGGNGFVQRLPGRALLTATRASTASSRARTRSTACSFPGMLIRRGSRANCR